MVLHSWGPEGGPLVARIELRNLARSVTSERSDAVGARTEALRESHCIFADKFGTGRPMQKRMTDANVAYIVIPKIFHHHDDKCRCGMGEFC
jgi:hypothetical protein